MAAGALAFQKMHSFFDVAGTWESIGRSVLSKISSCIIRTEVFQRLYQMNKYSLHFQSSHPCTISKALAGFVVMPGEAPHSISTHLRHIRPAIHGHKHTAANKVHILAGVLHAFVRNKSRGMPSKLI